MNPTSSHRTQRPRILSLSSFSARYRLGIRPERQTPHPPTRESDLMWSVPPPSLNAAKEMFRDRLLLCIIWPSWFCQLRRFWRHSLNPDALFHILPRGSPLFPKTNEEGVERVMRSDEGGTDPFFLPSLHRARVLKSRSEIALIRKADAIRSRAHRRDYHEGVAGQNGATSWSCYYSTNRFFSSRY